VAIIAIRSFHSKIKKVVPSGSQSKQCSARSIVCLNGGAGLQACDRTFKQKMYAACCSIVCFVVAYHPGSQAQRAILSGMRSDIKTKKYAACCNIVCFVVAHHPGSRVPSIQDEQSVSLVNCSAINYLKIL
jgi:hypothetical protein